MSPRPASLPLPAPGNPGGGGNGSGGNGGGGNGGGGNVVKVRVATMMHTHSYQ